MPVIGRALGILVVLLLACVPAGSALGSSRFYIRGAGYGHGVGMSQYGAYGYALHGKDWRYILQHYYTGTQLSSTGSGQVVRVLLRSENRISFSGATRAGTRALQPGKRYSVTRRDSGSVVLRSPSGRRLKTFPSPLRVTGPAPLTLYGTAANGVRDGEYRGALEFRAGLFGGVNAINAVGLEDYVRGVVPSEMPATWPADALRAQAVAARTYALTSNVGGNGFNQYADTRSQVYRGVVAETPASNQAVTETARDIVTYGGTPVTTFFFSTSGGRTEDIQFSFLGAQPDPWLTSVSDPFDSISPRHRWGPYRHTLTWAGRKLRGYVKGHFRGIRVLKRGVSPRVVYAEVVGTRGTTRITGPSLRSRFGLFDTWSYFTTITSKKKSPPAVPPDDQQGQPNDPSGGAPAPSASASTAGLRVLGGTIIGGRPGARLAVQRRLSGRWRTVAHTSLHRDGTYRTEVRGGTYRMRYGPLAGPTTHVR